MKLALKSFLFLSAFASLAFLGLEMADAYQLFKVNKAISAGGFPMQFGITNAVVTPCTCGNPTCTTCSGAGQCSMALAPCTTYNDVTGSKAGGDGNDILMSVVATQKIGLSSGGQLIAGGTSPIMISICASSGGLMEQCSQ